MPRRAQAVRNYVFTWNNYPEDAIQQIESWTCYSYVIAGREVGENGTPHLQGFIRLDTKRTLRGLKRILPDEIHWESAKTVGEAIEYCKKDGDYVEFGDVPRGAEKKSSLSNLVAVFQQEGLAACKEQFPGLCVMYGRKLLDMYGCNPKPRPNIEVHWLWGEPGVGKSRIAHSALPTAYLKPSTTKWWNGYEGQRMVIIDDVTPGGIGINHFLKWFDRYKCLVEVKGGMMALAAEQFIVTSNFRPRVVWPDTDQVTIDALHRRMTVWYIDQDGKMNLE